VSLSSLRGVISTSGERWNGVPRGHSVGVSSPGGASQSADHAGGDASGKTEGVTDGDDELPDAGSRRQAAQAVGSCCSPEARRGRRAGRDR
jgi:hypothetical protein